MAVAGLLASCAQRRPAAVPVQPSAPSQRAPVTSHPTRKETPAPPPVLLPQIGQGHGEDRRLLAEANAKVESAERVVRQIDETKLRRDQQETLSTVRSFLVKAREALSSRDVLRALNLADKAKILADHLLGAVR
jgi:hypothetical protein